MESRLSVDENGDNGLILSEKYLPEELIEEILFNVDSRTLRNCHMVCVRWKMLMESRIWRKKAESICRHHNNLAPVNNAHWSTYYTICKNEFERNLLLNCSGQDGPTTHWKTLKGDNASWQVDGPLIGPRGPLPIGVWARKEMKIQCFVATSEVPWQQPTFYFIDKVCSKQQTINLANEGFTSSVLDNLQPPIVVSEKFRCDGLIFKPYYECRVQLLGSKKNIIDAYEIKAYPTMHNPPTILGWHYVSYVIRNYGRGLRKIVFSHGGCGRCKMSCASVRLKIDERPEILRNTSHLVEEKLVIKKRRLPPKNSY